MEDIINFDPFRCGSVIKYFVFITIVDITQENYFNVCENSHIELLVNVSERSPNASVSVHGFRGDVRGRYVTNSNIGISELVYN